MSWFSWFRSGERPDFWKPSKRLIYSYFDGEKTLHADPMVLYRALVGCGPELSAAIKVATSPLDAADKAQDEVLGKLRKIFNVKPKLEGGLTETEVVDLFDHFLIFTESVKKKPKKSATSSDQTSSAASPGSWGDAPPTPTSSASGSTASGPSTDKPTPLPSGPESPSGSSTPDVSSGGT